MLDQKGRGSCPRLFIFVKSPIMRLRCHLVLRPLTSIMFLRLILLGLAGSSTLLSAADVALPPAFPGHWNSFGRVTPEATNESVTLQDGFIATKESWGDCEFAFSAR